jgi:hypothetical protein
MKIVEKPNLYYDKYKYRAHLTHPDFNIARYAKNEFELQRAIENRYVNNVYYFAITGTNRNEKVELVNKVLLSNFIDWRNNFSDKTTIRMDYNSISVYSNDLNLLKTLETLGPEVEYYEIELTGSPDLLLRENPKHPYRTYFKSKTVPMDFHDELKSFLESYKNSAFPCGALLNWANNLPIRQQWKRKYIEASYFIEYDNESFRTILGLTFDRYLGKTYKVEERYKIR